MDCSPPGSSVQGILQARTLEWIAIPFSQVGDGGNIPEPGIKPGSSALQETQVQSLEKEMATHFQYLVWRIPWTEEPGGLQSMGLQRVKHS